MTMPHLTGAQLAQKLLAIKPDIPIILCTGFSELINEKKAKAIGIREYIMKPIVIQELAMVLRKALDER
jgi:YesN/AraC family two-component response regulator